MNIYVLNIETATASTKNIGVFANERLAKQAAKKYIEEHTLDVKKKRAKKDEIRKVLYVENTMETPFAITMTAVKFNLEEIMEKQSRILKEIQLAEPAEQAESVEPTEQAPKTPKKITAYTIFAKENRQRIKEKFSDFNPKYKDVNGFLREEWSGMSKEDKEEYKIKASALAQ
jgi:hypothetical protein